MADEHDNTEKRETLEAYTDEAGRVCVMLALDVEPGADPPTRVRLFRAGDNPTTKGTLVYNSESADAIRTVLAEDGREQLPFDYGHGMLASSPTPDNGKAAAWFTPDAAEDGLYADRIEWTAPADAALRAREYRFFSPAVHRDIKTGLVTRLVNVALTNLPATKGQRPLVASETTTMPQAGTENIGEQLMKNLIELLGAEDEASACVLVAEQNKAKAELLADRDALAAKLTAAQAESTKLAERIAALESERAVAERDALIARLSEDGKLPPALHDWARTLTTEQLAAFGEKAPSAKPAPLPPVSDEVALTDEDLRVMAAHGITREQFIAARKAEKATR